MRKSSHNRDYAIRRFQMPRSFFLPPCFAGLMSFYFFSIFNVQTSSLKNSHAFGCFIIGGFTNLHKIILVQKPFEVSIKAIDGRSLVFGFITYETILLEIELRGYNSYIVFNFIKIPLSSMILGLFRLSKYNLNMNWDAFQSKSFVSIDSKCLASLTI